MDIDKLDIEINATAEGADDALSRLIQEIEAIQAALDGLDISELKRAANEMNGIDFDVSGIAEIKKAADSVKPALDEVKESLHGAQEAAEEFKMPDVDVEIPDVDINIDTGDANEKMADLIREASRLDDIIEDYDYSQEYRKMAQELREVIEEYSALQNYVDRLKSKGFDSSPDLRAQKIFGEAVTDMDKMSGLGEKIIHDMQQMKEIGGHLKMPEGGDISMTQVTDVSIPKDDRLPWLASLVAAGHELQKIVDGLSKAADAGAKALKTLYTPFAKIGTSFKKTAAGIASSFGKMNSAIARHLGKIPALWNHTLKALSTKAFRAAINEVTKSISDATASLAQFNGRVGRDINNAMSTMTSDFKWLAGNIVAALAPLASAIAPIVDAIVNQLSAAIGVVNQFFAALTGKSVYATAKKTVVDYGESVGGTAKEQKELNKQLASFDKLNVISSQASASPDSSGAGAAAYPYEWEEHTVDSDIAAMADKVKDILKDLFSPIKAAWDEAGQYVKTGFTEMVGAMKELMKAVGSDFLTMWKQTETKDLFKDVFIIVGDLERVIANLAKNFTIAWNVDKTGLHILENARDIAAILVSHLRSVTEYMTGWSASIDFGPALKATENFTRSLKRVADFVGGVFEDVMKRVVLEHIKYLTEEGVPNMMNAIARINDTFNFNKIRIDLHPVEDAIATLLRNIDAGITIAVENLGMRVAKWFNGDEFTKFCQRIADIANLIDKEDVAKILEGMGLAILHIGESVVKFVNSDLFMNFCKGLDEWLGKKTAEDIATIIERIAFAIGAFKFTAFVGQGLVGFIEFTAVVSASANIGSILSGMGAGASAAGAGTTAAAGGFGAFVSAAAPFIAIAAGVVAGLAAVYATNEDVRDSFHESVDAIKAGLQPGLEYMANTVLPGLSAAWKGLLDILSPLGTFLKDAFTSIWQDMINPALKSIGEEVLPRLQTSFELLWEKVLVPLGKFLYDTLKPAIEAVGDVLGVLWKSFVVPVAQAVGTLLKGAFDVLIEVLDIAIRITGEFITGCQAILDLAIKPFVTVVWNTLFPIFKTVFEGVGKLITDLRKIFKGLIDFIVGVFTLDWGKAWGGIHDIVEGVAHALATIFVTPINAVIAMFEGFVNGVIKAFNGIKQVMNKFSFTVPDWVPEIGGEKIGFDFKMSDTITLPRVKIGRFSTGGFPEDGLFFANHSEMIGRFDNGKNVVANNQQITDGISDAVRTALQDEIGGYIRIIAVNSSKTATSNEAIAKKPVLSSRDIFSAVRSEDQARYQRTGQPSFNV